MKINGPQLRLFGGRIDAEQYLHETLLTYPPLAYLQSHAGPEDYILSVNNCSTGYAPNIGRFHCEVFQDSADAREGVSEALRERSYKFLLLPKTRLGKGVDAELGLDFPRKVVYQNDYATVYRLRKPDSAAQADE